MQKGKHSLIKVCMQKLLMAMDNLVSVCLLSLPYWSASHVKLVIVEYEYH